MPSAVLTAGYAVALMAAAYLGTWALAAAVLVGQSVLAVGWFRLLRASTTGPGTGIAVAAAALADVTVASRTDAGVAPVAGVLGLMVVAALFQQVQQVQRASQRASRRRGRHRAGTQRVVVSLTATVSGATVAVFPVGYLALDDVTRAGPGILAAVVAGTAAAGLVYLVPAEPAVYLPAALAAAGTAGAAVSAATGLGSGRHGVFFALAGGTLALVGRRVTGYGEPPVPASRPAAVMLPLALGGPAAYLLGHVLVG